jgi:predicted outer membrane lipoprotein
LPDPRSHADRPTPRLGVSPDLRLSLDENGSPATVPPGDWLVCFVPGLQKQWCHPFVHGRHKHVFAMRAEPTGMWTLFEPWWRRLLTASTFGILNAMWLEMKQGCAQAAVPGRANADSEV